MRTYGTLAIKDGEWWVTRCEPHVAGRLKANFGKIPKHSKVPFRLGPVANLMIAADLSWFVSRYPMVAEPEVLAQLEGARQGFEELQAEAGRILSPDYEPGLFVGLRAGQEVRAHQAQAAELMARFQGLLVGDDVGEGKTYTGGACCLIPGALPATVVCPPHLREQWATKLREFTTLSVHVVTTTKPHPMPPADVRIFSYTQLAGWIDYLPNLGTGLAIFDEIHDVRHGRSTDKGVAAGALADASRFKLGLSATPIFNYGDEIWNVMRFLRPEVLGEREDFMREWCGGTTSVSDPHALGAFLREQNAMIRKRGSAPPANVVVQTISHDIQRLESVEDVARALALTARHGPGEARGMAAAQLDMLLRQETGIAKAKSVAAFVRILVEGGRKVILFGWHRAVYDIWLADLGEFAPVLYTGTESPKQKQRSLDAFIAGPSRVFIMSLRSGQGVDGLQHASKTVVIGELDWSPSVHKQNIGRVNREGQLCWPEPVDAFYLIADDGSDPALVEVNGLKASQAHGIVDPGLAVHRSPSDLRPLERLVESYLARAGKAVAA